MRTTTLLIVCFIWFACVTLAGTITFNDLTDTVTVSVVSSVGTVSGVGCSAAETCSFTITPPTGTVSLMSFPLFPGYDILEPGTFVDSDRVTDTHDGLVFTFTFVSDSEGGLGPPNPSYFLLTENGTSQLLVPFIYLNAAGAALGIDEIRFQSDVEVPEPATGLLTVGGLAWLLLGVRRNRMNR